MAKEKLDQEIAELLNWSNPLEKRIQVDQEEIKRIKEELDKEKKRVYDETLETQARHILIELSETDRDARLEELRKRNSFLSVRLQVFESILKKIEEILTRIHARGRIDAWRTDGTVGVFIKGAAEAEEEPATTETP